MVRNITHKAIDSYLLTDKVFQNRSEILRKDPQALLYRDPYFRFKRIIIALKKEKKLPNKPYKWLDLGCHSGQFVSMVLNYYDNIKVTGMDDWDVKSQVPWLDFDYHKTDLEKDWDIVLNNNFNVISALEVIEHMTDTDNFLIKCHNKLEPQGLLVISTPNLNSLRNRISFPFGGYPSCMEYRNLIHHVRLYNLPKITSQLHEHGFKIIKSIGVNFLPTMFLKYSPYRIVNDKLANVFPSLCPNIIIIAQKQ